VSPHSTYETLRHLADSWGLVAMAIVFLVLVAWPFRPSARSRNQSAATTIFEDDEQ
jgi:cytochrome c oxidase cbb3-type subunit IV